MTEDEVEVDLSGLTEAQRKQYFERSGKHIRKTDELIRDISPEPGGPDRLGALIDAWNACTDSDRKSFIERLLYTGRLMKHE